MAWRETYPYEAPSRPKNAGRFAGGAMYPIIIKQPDDKPPAPTPAIARPITRATEVGATPHIRLPASKMPNTNYQYFRGMNDYQCTYYIGG